MKQQLVPYRNGHKLDSLDQFERSFDVVEITEFFWGLFDKVRETQWNS